MNKPVGLIGGMGCGKTTVLNIFKEKGFNVLNSDSLLHAMYEPSHKRFPILVELIDSWLGTNFKEKNQISREVLRQKIQTPEQLEKAMHLFKDCIVEEIQSQCETLEKVIVEAPLLLEMNLQDSFSKIICVSCNSDEQIDRILKRDSHLSMEKIRARLLVQKSNEYKEKNSHFVIHNDSDIEDLKYQVIKLIEKLP